MGIGERDLQTHAIIGAAMEVHGALGSGFLEAIYRDALEVEFQDRGIPYCREHEVPVFYRGRRMGAQYRADFLCFGEIIVELKASKALTGNDDAQVIHYLRATCLKRAILLNFGTPSLQFKRLVNNLRTSADSSVLS